MHYSKLLIVLLGSVFVGCATQQGVWVKANSVPLQVDQDKYACLQQSQQPYGYSTGGFGWEPGWGGFNGYSGMQTNPDLYSACMKAGGYYWQPDMPPK